METKVRFKKSSDGYQIIYLDTCFKGTRKYKMLGLKVKTNPKSPSDKQDRKQKLEMAKNLAMKVDLDLFNGKFLVENKIDTSIDFIEFSKKWMEDANSVIDIRIYRAAINKLISFSGEKIYCFEIDESFLNRYYNFLHRSLNGVTPHNYMKKLKVIIKSAKRKNHFYKDPTEYLKLKKGKSADKDYLTFDEIKTLTNTPCNNNLIKRASLFSANTGLRFCDIIKLKWSNINDNTLSITQAKTKVPVTISLNSDSIILLGEKRDGNDYIFPLCSHTGVLKSLRKWVKDAGINKSITYHCFRVSFATNLMNTGCDVAVTSKLLGHTSLANTERYIRISELLKQNATSKFPSFL